MAAKVAFSVGSNHSALTTPAFRLSQTIALVTPPKNDERPHLAFDPVRQLLAEAGKGEGQVRGAQHRDKDLGGMDDAGDRIDHRHRLAGIVGLHHRTRRMPMAECRARPALESGEVLAEPSVAVAVGMGGAILLPQQRQRHALAFQLPGDQRPVRLAQIMGRPAEPTEQQPLKHRVVVMARRQRPADSPASRARSR